MAHWQDLFPIKLVNDFCDFLKFILTDQFEGLLLLSKHEVAFDDHPQFSVLCFDKFVFSYTVVRIATI